MEALAKVVSEYHVRDVIAQNARALLDKARPVLGDPTDVSFNGYNGTIGLHWAKAEIPVEVEISEAEFELYRFVSRTEISHCPVEELDVFISQLSRASRGDQGGRWM